MASEERIFDIDEVRNQTRELVSDSFDADSPVLVEAPPNSGKTTSSIACVKEFKDQGIDKPVTYLAGRVDLYKEAVKKCEKHNLSYKEIPSPHRDCETFSGKSAYAVQKLYQKGIPARAIHYQSYRHVKLECGGSGSCEYLSDIEDIEDDIDKIDVLIGHHKHSYRDEYIRDRVVIIDEFNLDPFLTSFPDSASNLEDAPDELVSSFLKEVSEESDDFPADEFKDVTDIIEKRRIPEFREPVLDWFREHGVSRDSVRKWDFYRPNADRYDTKHYDAPFLTLALFMMQRVATQTEKAPPVKDKSLRDEWDELDIPEGWQCVRDRNSGEMYTLTPPSLQSASQVIGLDALPTEELWNLVFGNQKEFEVKRVIEREDYPSYISDVLNMELIQVGNGRHPYSGGTTSNQDRDRFATIVSKEERKPAVVSTKKALDRYNLNSLGISERYFAISDDGLETKNFAKVRSSNEFAEHSLGAVFGCPNPGNNVFYRWVGFCATSESTSDLETSRLNRLVKNHIIEHQVIQAIFRFGRLDEVIDNGGSTVYVSTTAVPDWLEFSREISIRSSKKSKAVIEQLIQKSRENPPSHSVSTIVEAVKQGDRVESISKPTARKALQSLVEIGAVEVKRNHGRNGAHLYFWRGEDYLQSHEDHRALIIEDEAWAL